MFLTEYHKINDVKIKTHFAGSHSFPRVTFKHFQGTQTKNAPHI